MKQKNQLNKKNVLTAFAVIGVFLILSTSFIQPITAKLVNKENLNNLSDENIVELLNNLINKEELRNLIKNILINRAVSENLQAFSKNLERDENFASFIGVLEDTYRDKLNDFLEEGISDSEPDENKIPSRFSNDNLMIQSNLFAFSLKKVKSSSIDKSLLLLEKIKNHKFLGKIFISLFKIAENKLFINKNENSIIKANSDVEIVLSNDGEEILRGSHISVSGYLLLLEYMLVDVQSEIDKNDSPIDEQCQLLGTYINFLADEDAKKLSKNLQYNEELVSAIKQNLSITLSELNGLTDEEKLEKLNNLAQIAQQYDKYSEFEELVQEKYQQIFNQAGIVGSILNLIGIFFILYGEGCFAGGLIFILVSLYVGLVAGWDYFWIFIPSAIYFFIFSMICFVAGGILLFF